MSYVQVSTLLNMQDILLFTFLRDIDALPAFDVRTAV